MSETEKQQRLEFNKKLEGKRVYIISGRGFYAFVKKALDLDMFIVEDDKNREYSVSIYDIRQLD